MGDADKVAPRNAVKGMASGADLAIYLIASPDAGRKSEHGFKTGSTRMIPGMVKAVEKALVRPRVGGRMEPLIAREAGVYLREEWEGAVEMGVPGYRTSSEE
jgi:hypothetical protein